MLFVLGTIGIVLFIVGVLVLVGRAYQGDSAQLVHWEPTRSPEVEAQNEIDDVRQMLEAQNEMRRRRARGAHDRGRPRAGGRQGRAVAAAGQGDFERTGAGGPAGPSS